METKISDEQFRLLPEEYTHSGGMLYVQHKRSDKAALYLHEMEDGLFSAEVFCIRTADASDMKMGGKVTHVPARERVPSNETFGAWAWCVSGKTKEQCVELANRIYEEIESGVRPKPIDK